VTPAERRAVVKTKQIDQIRAQLAQVRVGIAEQEDVIARANGHIAKLREHELNDQALLEVLRRSEEPVS